jgi:aspartyl protease family protein
MRNTIILAVVAFVVAASATSVVARFSAKTAPPPAQAEMATSLAAGRVILVAGQGGHFQVGALIDKTYVDFIVDTGASRVALTYRDAQKLGMKLSSRDFKVPMQTANGIVYAADVRIPSIKIKSITLNNVAAVVMPAGAMNVNLLGNSFLARLKSYEVRSGQLSLEQ